MLMFSTIKNYKSSKLPFKPTGAGCLTSSEYTEVHSHKSQQVQRLDAMAQQGSANPDILTGNLGRISNSLLNCKTGASVFLFVSETERFHLLIFSHYEEKITSTGGWSVTICLCCPPTGEDWPGLHIYRKDVCCWSCLSV